MNVEKVMGELTEDEKIDLLSGVGNWHTNSCNGKVPVLMMTDGPHGLRKVVNEEANDINDSLPATCFPTASAIASSWNTDISRMMGEAIGSEAKKEQVSIVLGCGVNMKRSPLCGRNFEYFSEDPYLAGKIGASYVNGLQSKGVGTSVKHFAGNNQETRRQSCNSQIDERALQEIYLRAFEIIVKEAKPTTLMSSYNRINGDYGCANKHTLTELLREKWGFKGGVISDWGATMNVVDCLRAGLTLEMPDCFGYHKKKLKEALKSGDFSKEELDKAASDVLEKIISLTENLDPTATVDYEYNHGIARRIEDECAVLLKNEGLLPLDKNKKLIVIGDLAKNMRIQGGGSSHINATKIPTAIDALETAGYEIKYLQGYRNVSDRKDDGLHNEAIEYLNNSKDNKDTVILYFMGLTDAYESEGFDRKNMNIPQCQIDLLKDVYKITDIPIIAVTFGGAPMDYSWEGMVSSILHMHLGGQAVGESIADIISGEVNPSGKLAETIPMCIDDTPANKYFALDKDDIEYRESIFIGYRYYETFGVPVRYPFGYGLSYTYFEYSNMEVSSKEYGGGNLKVKCKVKNIGQKKGSEVVQLYVLPPRDNIIRAAKELKAFAKVDLLPGEEKEITFDLDERAFAIYCDDSKEFEMISGEYSIAIGASVKDERLTESVTILGREYFRNERELFPSYFAENKHGMDIPAKEFEKLLGQPLSDLQNRKRGEYDITCTFGDVSKASVFGKVVRKVVQKEIDKKLQNMAEDDPIREMTVMGVEEGALESLISISGGQINSKLVTSLVDCANGHSVRGIINMIKKDK